jgi:co-chaperonin GroES (HSP10)
VNTSGINPTGHMVVVECEKMEEKTAGGIILPGTILDRENTASQKGRMVAKGPTAGDFTAWPEGHEFPPAGSRVLIRKFAGVEVKGNDGKEYRVCEDKDILAVLEG